MTVSEKVMQRSLNINVVTNVEDGGEVKTKARSYSKVNTQASLDQLHAAATALGGLMSEDVDSVGYTDKKVLQVA